ncbi:inositol 2-dehydrogenase [Caulobacter segnis]|uniref:inositol 2-dehydrogenase n=1 Tax=Caulobacter segnis TaxID=88688 RepID=UPI001CBEAE8C|nr:inositol 2-dehydrogenase [Caulobacter segnis]UAL12365.1 inositol 2-dehydrogenase [Caulobacter segnis]
MIKVAQLGAGRMGAVHARNAAANQRLDLVALVDPRPDVAGPLAAELGAALRGFDEVLADPEIRGIIVASSTDAHLDNTLSALRAGKAVFCEKPLDLRLATLLAAKGELEAAEDRLFVAFNRRFDPHYRALKARIDGGDIGALESLHIVNHDPATPPPAFIPTSGGLFKDFTIHDFDLAPWLMGEAPVEVFAWASCLIDPQIGALGDVDTAKVLLTTATGRLCMISNSRRTGYGYDQRIEAFGSNGAARVDNVTNTAVSVWGESGAKADRFPYAFIDRYAGAYAAEMDHFADVLDGKASPEAGLLASIASLELAEAAARSVATGAPVRL